MGVIMIQYDSKCWNQWIETPGWCSSFSWQVHVRSCSLDFTHWIWVFTKMRSTLKCSWNEWKHIIKYQTGGFEHCLYSNHKWDDDPSRLFSGNVTQYKFYGRPSHTASHKHPGALWGSLGRLHNHEAVIKRQITFGVGGMVSRTHGIPWSSPLLVNFSCWVHPPAKKVNPALCNFWRALKIAPRRWRRRRRPDVI